LFPVRANVPSATVVDWKPLSVPVIVQRPRPSLTSVWKLVSVPGRVSADPTAPFSRRVLVPPPPLMLPLTLPSAATVQAEAIFCSESPSNCVLLAAALSAAVVGCAGCTDWIAVMTTLIFQ